MKNKKKIEIVKGDFTPEEALEIVNHLLSKKINFHEAKNFGSKIKTGEENKQSIKRSKELKESKENFLNWTEKAMKKDKTIRIKSNITIDFI